MTPQLSTKRGRLWLNPVSTELGEGQFLSQRARVQRGSSEAARCAIFPPTPLGHGLNGSPTAPVERAHSDRARSGSTGEPSAHDRTPMMMNQQPLISDLTDSGLEFAIFSLASFHLLH